MQNPLPSDADILVATLFGAPVFMRGGRVLRISERKNRGLLAYLVAGAGVTHGRDRLAELFWPETRGDAGRASLRQGLSTIRAALGDGDARLLVAERDTVLLRAQGVVSDVSRLEDLARRADLPEDPPEIPPTFLEGLSGISAGFDNWRAGEEIRLAGIAVRVLEGRAKLAETAGRMADAATLLARAAALDPLNEELARQLMTALAASGQRSKALVRFHALEAALQTDLGVAPETATSRLARDIAGGRMVSSAVTHSAAETAAVAKTGRRFPRTRYAKAGALNIAWQSHGSGPVDLVYVSGWASNLDYSWNHPVFARFLDGLGRLGRVIRLDKRGTGLSDRNVGFPTLEERVEDLHAVMDAAGSRRAVLLGTSEGGNLCMLFAATCPDRCAGLILYGAFAKGLWAPDYPWAKTAAQVEEELAEIERDWGGAFDFQRGAPSLVGDTWAAEWFAAEMRQSASKQDALDLWRWNSEIDVRPILPAIRVPTLVLHRTGDLWVKVEEGRYLAERIAGARFVEMPGNDHIIWAGDAERALSEIEMFVTGLEDRPIEPVLLTLLAAEGAGIDAPKVPGFLEHSAGNRHLWSFAGPTGAIKAGLALCAETGGARAAVHLGECARGSRGVTGPAVSEVWQLIERAEPGALMASRAVRDLTIGAPFRLVPATGEDEAQAFRVVPA